MTREITRVTNDIRYVATISLPTGKVISKHTEWKPSHWDNSGMRSEFVHQMDLLVREWERDFGYADLQYTLMIEKRKVIEIVETYTQTMFDSIHTPGSKR